MVDNPSLIARQLFPYQEISSSKVSTAINKFGDKALRYEVDGKKYIQLTSWWKHQPLQYAVPSNYPAPAGWADRIRTTYKGKALVCNWPGQKDTKLGILLAERLGRLGRISSWKDYVDSLDDDELDTLARNPSREPYLDTLARNPSQESYLDTLARNPSRDAYLDTLNSNSNFNSNFNTNTNAFKKIKRPPLTPPKAETEKHAAASSFDISSANSFAIYERLFGELTEKASEQLKGLEDEYSEFAVLQAMKEAYFNDAKKMSYVTAILRNWRAEKRLPVAAEPDEDEGGYWEVSETGAQRWVKYG